MRQGANRGETARKGSCVRTRFCGEGARQLTLLLERKSASDVKLSMAMHGEEFSSLDSDAKMQPSLVDAVAIQFPNGRPYDFIQWSNSNPADSFQAIA